MFWFIDGPTLACGWVNFSILWPHTPVQTKLKCPPPHFPLGGTFRAERHFLLFKDQLAESGRQKTEENIIPRGKFRPMENEPYDSFSEMYLFRRFTNSIQIMPLISQMFREEKFAVCLPKDVS